MRHRVLALFTLLVMACVPRTAEAPVGTPERSVRVTLHGDTRFSPAERDVADRSGKSVETFTGGRAHIAFVWDYDQVRFVAIAKGGHWRMVRTRPSDVKTGVVGFMHDNREIGIVADRCRDLDACIMHELGHLIGMDDLAEPGSVMSLVNAGHHWTAADLAECVRVGMCTDPHKRDETTVTMTVDPSIPPIDPMPPGWTWTDR